jgi:hypothetical protein
MIENCLLWGWVHLDQTPRWTSNQLVLFSRNWEKKKNPHINVTCRQHISRKWNTKYDIYTGGDKNLRSKTNCGAILQQLQNRAAVECSMEVDDHCCQREKSAHMWCCYFIVTLLSLDITLMVILWSPPSPLFFLFPTNNHLSVLLF